MCVCKRAKDRLIFVENSGIKKVSMVIGNTWPPTGGRTEIIRGKADQLRNGQSGGVAYCVFLNPRTLHLNLPGQSF